MRALEILKDLIKIDTRNPPGVTSAAVEYLLKIFSSYNTKIYSKVEGKDNLVVEISKGDPTIMLTSHLDTVPSPDALLNPVVVDGKLYGRGSCDAKGCVAAICEAALNLNVDCGVKLAFTADEEVGGVNGLAYVFEKEKADAVIIGEPTGCDTVGALQAAVLAIDITVKGESGHTAAQDARKGAICKAADYLLQRVDKFREMNGGFERYKRFVEDLGFEFVVKSWHAVFNPSIIKGGIKRNVVAPECTISADVRFAPWISVEDVRKALYEDYVEFKVEGLLQPYGILCDSVEEEKDKWLLEIMGKAIKKEGRKPKAVFSLGVGDTRHIRKHGIPAFYLGPGGGDLHGENEFVYLSELESTTSVYRNIVEIFSESGDLTFDN